VDFRGRAQRRRKHTTPLPGHWYIHPELMLRVYCKRVTMNLVYTVDHPDDYKEDTWNERFFMRDFVPCEDRTISHPLVRCPSDCPTCFHPRITAAADKAVRMVDKSRRTQ
jgi:hypothetical protein